MQRNSPASAGFDAAPEYSGHHQQQTSPTEHEFGSPPPYTSTTDHPTASKGFSSQDDPYDNVPLNQPGSSSLAGEAYTSEPPMSAASTDPWSKYDNTPGCCCSTTGGCCFSSRGGCCFSDTEGCCFSTTKGCCFSSDAACCFSGRSSKNRR